MDTSAHGPHDETTEWLMPQAPDQDDVIDAGPRQPGRRRTVGMTIGLLALGAIGGAIAVSQLSSNTSPQATAANLPPGASSGNGLGTQGGQGGLGGQGGQGGQLRGGQGGALPGEQRLQGTLTAISGSTITVKTSRGTTSYSVTDTTDIVRNGARATLSQLSAGDAVFLHVYPSASGGSMLVERIFAGTLPAGGRFGPFGGDGNGDRGASGNDQSTHI